MVDSFLHYLTYERRFSEHTLTAYRSDLEQFNSFLTEIDPDLTSVRAEFMHIRAWVIHLMEADIAPRSINRKLASLRTYFRFLKQRGVVEVDHFQKLNALKIKKSLPVFVQEESMSALLDEFPFEDSFSGWRDRLVLELFYATGIRLSELLNLKERDINRFERTIKVLGKRNKERIIPFPKNLGLIIENYLNRKNIEFGHNSGLPLIVTDKGRPGYPMFVYRIVNKYLNLIPSIDKKSPHVLRHTYATHLLDKGADLNAIKALLGHSSLAATQVYTHNSLERLKAVFDQAHPKA